MRHVQRARLGMTIVLLSTVSLGAAAQDPPSFAPDPFWPKHLPNQWILGQVSGVAVDRNDHVWIVQRPGTTGAAGHGVRSGRQPGPGLGRSGRGL